MFARFPDHHEIATSTTSNSSSQCFSTATHPHQHEQQQEDNNNDDASFPMSSISDDASHTHHQHAPTSQEASKAKPFYSASEASIRRKHQELEAKDSDTRVLKLAEREMQQLYDPKDFARQDKIMASLESNIRALKTQNETAYQKIRECARLSSANEAMGANIQEMERYIVEIEEVAGDLLESEVTIRELSVLLDESRTESAAFQDEVALLQEELARKKDALSQARGATAMLRRQVTELMARAEEDQQEMVRLQDEADTNTFHLHNEVEDLYSKCEIWQRECVRLEGKLEKMVQEKEEVEAPRARAAMQEKEKEAKEEQHARTCDEAALLKASNDSLWSRLEAIHAELSEETLQKEAAQQEKEALAAELLSMQAASQGREEEVSSLRIVNVRLKDQVEAMKEERQQHAREIASLRRTTAIAPLSARPHQRPSSSFSPSSSSGGMVNVRTPLKELLRAAGTRASPAFGSSSPSSSCAEGPHALLAPPALASLSSSLRPGPLARVLGGKKKS